MFQRIRALARYGAPTGSPPVAAAVSDRPLARISAQRPDLGFGAVRVIERGDYRAELRGDDGEGRRGDIARRPRVGDHTAGVGRARVGDLEVRRCAESRVALDGARPLE